MITVVLFAHNLNTYAGALQFVRENQVAVPYLVQRMCGAIIAVTFTLITGRSGRNK